MRDISSILSAKLKIWFRLYQFTQLAESIYNEQYYIYIYLMFIVIIYRLALAITIIISYLIRKLDIIYNNIVSILNRCKRSTFAHSSYIYNLYVIVPT